MKKHYIGALIFIVLLQTAKSQSFSRPNEWKKFRREVYFSTGTANFLGDLGGRNKKGTDYSPADLNLSQSRSAFGLGARYRLLKHVNVAAQLSEGECIGQI